MSGRVSKVRPMIRTSAVSLMSISSSKDCRSGLSWKSVLAA